MRNPIIPLHPHRHVRRMGFTLIEMLIVIVVVAALAALIFTLSRNARLAAAKVGSVNQMRSIGIAVRSWSDDKGLTEPMFYSNGTGDFPHEGQSNGKAVTPGNPARALFNHMERESSYIDDPAVFFSPLVETAVPAPDKYRPDQANETNIWGTFAWLHPFVPVERRNGFQKAALGTGHSPGKVRPAIEGRFMMSESYAFRKPKFDKEIFHALMIDGSVQHAGDSADVWKLWKEGP